MFVLVFAVPALVVVTIGYVAGFAVWTVLGGWVDAAAGTSIASGAEPVGWITGLALLIGTARAAVRYRRRTRRSGDVPD